MAGSSHQDNGATRDALIQWSKGTASAHPSVAVLSASLLKKSSVPTLADYDRLALQWRQEMVLPRRHRTTGTIVSAAWTEEQPFLRPVPTRHLHAPTDPALPLSVIDLAQRRLGEQVEVWDLAEYEVAL